MPNRNIGGIAATTANATAAPQRLRAGTDGLDSLLNYTSLVSQRRMNTVSFQVPRSHSLRCFQQLRPRFAIIIPVIKDGQVLPRVKSNGNAETGDAELATAGEHGCLLVSNKAESRAAEAESYHQDTKRTNHG
jgi:hypothetical protein